jgi:hypothetical protein
MASPQVADFSELLFHYLGETNTSLLHYKVIGKFSEEGKIAS